MNREEANQWIERFYLFKQEPVFRRWDSRRRNASSERRIWPRWTAFLRPWHLSIPQHHLIPRWYSSIFHRRSLNDFLSGSDASRMSATQCSASSSEWTILNTFTNPYCDRCTTLPSGWYRFQKQYDYTSDPGLPTDWIWVGYTNALLLVHFGGFKTAQSSFRALSNSYWSY